MSLKEDVIEAYGKPKVIVANSMEEINAMRYKALDAYRKGLNNNLVFTEVLNCDYMLHGELNAGMISFITGTVQAAYRDHNYFKHTEITVDDIQEVITDFLHVAKNGLYLNLAISKWCMVVIQNATKNMLRDRYRALSRNVDLCNYSMIVDIDSVNPDDLLDEINLDPAVLYELEEEERVLKEVLSPRQLEAVELREDGFAVKEIAKELGISKGVTQKHLDRAREKMQEVRVTYKQNKLRGVTKDAT